MEFIMEAATPKTWWIVSIVMCQLYLKNKVQEWFSATEYLVMHHVFQNGIEILKPELGSLPGDLGHAPVAHKGYFCKLFIYPFIRFPPSP